MKTKNHERIRQAEFAPVKTEYMAFLNFKRSIKHSAKVPEFAVLEVDLSKKEKQTNKKQLIFQSVEQPAGFAVGFDSTVKFFTSLLDFISFFVPLYSCTLVICFNIK